MSQYEAKRRACPECGAGMPPDARTCWLCHGRPGPAATVGESPFAATERHAAVQFSLASMLLLVALFAVIFGVAAIAPGLGVGLAILSAPALIRTAIVASRRRSVGHPLDMWTKVWVFAGTLGLIAVILAAAVGAFIATCFPLGAAGFAANSPALAIFAWVVGLGVAILVCYGLFRLFRRIWPRG